MKRIFLDKEPFNYIFFINSYLKHLIKYFPNTKIIESKKYIHFSFFYKIVASFKSNNLNSLI